MKHANARTSTLRKDFRYFLGRARQSSARRSSTHAAWRARSDAPYLPRRGPVAVAVGLWLLAAVAHAAPALMIGEHAALPGGSVRVAVKMPDATGVAATSFIVNFDPQLLTLTNVSTGALGGAFSLGYNIEEGRVSVALVRDAALITGSGSLAYLEFKANAGAVPGMSTPLAIADRGVSGQFAVALTAVQSNGLVRIVTANQDSNADGLPDWWEELYFEGPTSAGAAVDADGDGQTNLQEFIAGTNPLDSTSALQATQLAADGSGFVLSFPTVLGRNYRVEYSSDLSFWTTLVANVAGTGGIVQVIDSVAFAEPARFYRIVSPP